MAIKRWTAGAADGNWSTAGNWSPSGAPVSTDDVFVEETNEDIDAGLNQSAVALSSLNIAQSFVGTIGTKDSPLQIGASDVRIGYRTSGTGTPAGSRRIHLDLGSATAAQVNVDGTASSAADTGLNPLRIKAANAATDIYIRGGFVSVADYPGETSTLDLSVSAGTVSLGQSNNNTAVTMVGVAITGGSSVIRSMPTTLIVEGGSCTTEGDGAITTANVRGGTAVFNNTGTITTLNAHKGTSDFTKSQTPRTVTTVNMKVGARLNYEPDVLTLTNRINVDETRAVGVTVS